MINEYYIEEYIREITPENNEFFKELEDYAEKNNIPIVEPEVAQLLKVLIKIQKPKKILEIGTAIGYSSLIMAESNDDVLITTIERNDEMISLAKKNISKTKYNSRINILEGDANELLEELDEKYDFIFLDAAKGQYINFFDKSVKLLNERGIIVSDNVLFKGMVASDKLVVRRKKTIVKRLRQYLKHINEKEGYISSTIPIGDGVSITYREG